MNVLVVAAHPDDEVYGAGGTIAKHVSKKDSVYVCILGEGVTSRYEKREQADRKEIEKLRKEAASAHKILGVKKAYFFDFPDNRFDSVDRLDMIKTVEKVLTEVKPDIVYTHHTGDLNIDHRITLDAVMVAARPGKVRKILCFEAVSSTEWNTPTPETYFMPNYFVDISGFLKKKIEAATCYGSEQRKFPHPRSPEGVEASAKKWGTVSGLKAAEPFVLVREVE